MSRRPQSVAEKERRARARRERRIIADFMPPEGVPLRFEVAPLGARFGAQLLDLLLTATFAIAVVALLAITDVVPGSAITLIGSLLFLFVRAPYYVATELAWNGQTVGKRAAHLRVVSADGRTLRPWAISVRNIMKEMEVFVPGTALFMSPFMGPVEAIVLLAWIALLLAVPLTNRRRQRLGDMIAGTYVIRQPRAVLMPDLGARAGAPWGERFSFLPHQLDHYGAFELQTLERVLHADTGRMGRIAAERHRKNLADIAGRIRAKIDYTDPVPEREVPAFLEAFYLAQRRYLESRKLFGDARADKYHAEDRAGAPR